MKNNVKNIFKKEMREVFRDKKSLLMMLVIPLMIPLLVIGMSALFDSQMNAPLENYNKIGIAYDVTEEEKKIIEEVGIDAVYGSVNDLLDKYSSEEVKLVVTKIGNVYSINEESASNASQLVENYISNYKDYLVSTYLGEKAVDLPMLTYSVREEGSEAENYFANYITVYAFLFIIMAITISATYPATDTTAGEKERGTLETLLTFPIKAKDIIVGKFLSVTTSSIITGILSLALAQLSLYIAGKTFNLYTDINILMSGKTIVLATLIIIGYSILISGLCIAIASKCKTFKEAQSALTPLTFISFFPGMIAFMMELKNSVVLSLVPFLNFTLIFNDMQAGKLELLNVILMLISTIIFIAVVLYIVVKSYKSEKVLF